MLTLLWDVDKLKQFHEKGRKLFADVTAVIDLVSGPIAAQHDSNLPQKLMRIRTTLHELTKGVFHFRRVPASQIFV